MAKLNGSLSPDQSKYITLTDGAGNLVTVTSVASGAPQPSTGNITPDGSRYATFTDGVGNLV